MPKASQAEKELRINVVYKMLLDGKTNADIVRYGSENWNIGERQMDDYLVWANERIIDESSEGREKTLADLRAKMKRLYALASTKEQYRVCLGIIQETHKVLGAYPKEQIELMTWQDRAIEDIKAGRLTYEAMSQLFDPDLATQLFTLAGVHVTSS
jgi:hypothetical protein